MLQPGLIELLSRATSSSGATTGRAAGRLLPRRRLRSLRPIVALYDFHASLLHLKQRQIDHAAPLYLRQTVLAHQVSVRRCAAIPRVIRLPSPAQREIDHHTNASVCKSSLHGLR